MINARWAWSIFNMCSLNCRRTGPFGKSFCTIIILQGRNIKFFSMMVRRLTNTSWTSFGGHSDTIHILGCCNSWKTCWEVLGKIVPFRWRFSIHFWLFFLAELHEEQDWNASRRRVAWAQTLSLVRRNAPPPPPQTNVVAHSTDAWWIDLPIQHNPFYML